METRKMISVSKFMSLVLRHKPAAAEISLDKGGWASTTALIKGMNKAGHAVDLNDLKYIVESNDKQRFKFSEDFSEIRANQGHSVAVAVEMDERKPPNVLFHGTATRFLAAIKQDGLIAKNRLHVHLSSDRETAEKVGARHGKSVILTINSAKMYNDGKIFYISENGVWLTADVPVEYIFNF